MLLGLLAAGAAAPGGVAGGALGAGGAHAAPGFDGVIFNQDRTIRPRRSVPTRIFCPGGKYIPFTWGFRPISAPQAGVSVNAILTGAVPVTNKRGVFAFDITLFNPNPGATVQMRVSTTCVKGRGGVKTKVAASSDAAAAKKKKKKKKRKLEADSERKKVTVPGGRRVTKKVFCDSKKNTEVADIGFKSSHSELVGAGYVDKKKRAGAEVTLQNRTTTDDKARVYAICIEGKRFKLRDKESAPIARRSSGARAVASDARTAVGKNTLLFDRTLFSIDDIVKAFDERQRRLELLVRCGSPVSAPGVSALPAGLGFRFGPKSGPAEEEFLITRSFAFLRERVNGEQMITTASAIEAVIDRILGDGFAEVVVPCVKDSTRVDSKSDVVDVM